MLEVIDSIALYCIIGEECGLIRVIKTRNGQYPLGTLVLTFCGWRTHYLSKDGSDLHSIQYDFGSLSPSVTLGVLGMPGYRDHLGPFLLIH